MLTKFTEMLLRWYEDNKRDLPWRGTADPYAIWISETMAQQTRITALLPYYKRFMALFPDAEALAEAPEEAVLKAWEGLGYYARARNLQKAAKIIVKQYGGRLPRDWDALMKLPGVGVYTAGAIAAIAFGQPRPAVDGNVLRVYARMACDKTPDAKAQAAAFVQEHMPETHISRFTQALMELGALVCLPGIPHCVDCPVADLCLAKAMQLEKVLPCKTKKAPKRDVKLTILILINPSGDILCRKRDEKLLKNLWEFFTAEEWLDTKYVWQFLEMHNLHLVGEPIPSANRSHTFTHLIWWMKGFICYIEENTPPDGYVFLSREKLSEVPIASALSFYRNAALSV